MFKKSILEPAKALVQALVCTLLLESTILVLAPCISGLYCCRTKYSVFHPLGNRFRQAMYQALCRLLGIWSYRFCPHGVHNKSKDDHNNDNKGIEEEHPLCSGGLENIKQTSCSLLRIIVANCPGFPLDTSVLFLSTPWLQWAFVANKQHLSVL